MTRKYSGRLGAGIALALVGAAVAYSLIPRPMAVEAARVARGPLVVSIDEPGQTRVKHRYMISAPLAGRVEPVQLRAGDPVVAGKTLLVRIRPTAPALLDARARVQAEAKIKSAEVNLKRARAALEAARAAHDFAQSEWHSAKLLHDQRSDLISKDDYEKARLIERTRREELKAAEYSQEIARIESEAAQAVVAGLPSQPSPATEPFEIRAPLTGRVLRLLHENADLVAPGTPLIEVGDPATMEVVVDVLSTDAVRIRPGAGVFIENWGGDAALRAVVRRVEPSAVTRISTLGISEQRVSVIADLTAPLDKRPQLGDGYRVEARIVVWENDNVLQVPMSALFRRGDNWCALRIESGRAARCTVAIGHRSDRKAEVLSGVAEGDWVIVHPGELVDDGMHVSVDSKKPRL